MPSKSIQRGFSLLSSESYEIVQGLIFREESFLIEKLIQGLYINKSNFLAN